MDHGEYLSELEREGRERQAKETSTKMTGDLARVMRGLGRKDRMSDEDREYESRARRLYPNSPTLWQRPRVDVQGKEAENPGDTGPAAAFPNSPQMTEPTRKLEDVPTVLYDRHGEELGRLDNPFTSSPGMSGEARFGINTVRETETAYTLEEKYPRTRLPAEPEPLPSLTKHGNRNP